METRDRLFVSYDVVVVGARCAGAATAMLLARSGKRVLMLERGRSGTDTLSTHGLMSAAVVALHRWNVLPAIEAAGTPLVGTTTFHYAEDEIALELTPRHGVAGLYAPRRTVLDRSLVDAAVDAGAHVLYGARVTELLRDGDCVTGVRFVSADGTAHDVTCELVVGADGRHSTVARRVGADPYRVSRHYTACLYTYVEHADARGYHWYYQPDAHAGLIPTNDGAHCVFVLVPPDRLPALRGTDPDERFARLVQPHAHLARVLGRARRVEPYRTFTGQPGFVRPAVGPGWALVGDAGYFKDPCTAHGITDALRDAELLALAALDGSAEAMSGYQRTRDALSTRFFELTDTIAAFPSDLDHLRTLHLDLSRQMRRETQFVADLTPHHVAA